MLTGSNRPEIVEQFTFRANGLEHTVDDAIIDTGAQNTYITQAVVDALGLQMLGEAEVGFTHESGAKATKYRCVVAWTIYEHQGYWSLQDVLCVPADMEVLIGFDFLTRHELTVDMHHRGLVGTAPSNAEPITGGGYVVNAPRWYLIELNRARADAAAPGEVLRPHPAGRFTRSAIMKK